MQPFSLLHKTTRVILFTIMVCNAHAKISRIPRQKCEALLVVARSCAVDVPKQRLQFCRPIYAKFQFLHKQLQYLGLVET